MGSIAGGGGGGAAHLQLGSSAWKGMLMVN